MFENPRRGRQARTFTTNVPKILDLKSSSEQIFFRKLSLGAPATMLEYLPMEKVGAVKDILQGGAVVYVNKDEVQRRVMKWLVICVLKRDCISPPGSTLYCGYNFPRDRFGGCHRYDQSLQNILISNAYNYGQEKYYYWSGSFAIVER